MDCVIIIRFNKQNINCGITNVINKQLNIMQSKASISEILDNHKSNSNNIGSKPPHQTFQLRFLIYSVVIGILLSVFFNSGKYFGKLYFYINYDNKEVEITKKKFESINAAGRDILTFPDGKQRQIELDDVFIACKTDWDNIL